MQINFYWIKFNSLHSLEVCLCPLILQCLLHIGVSIIFLKHTLVHVTSMLKTPQYFPRVKKKLLTMLHKALYDLHVPTSPTPSHHTPVQQPYSSAPQMHHSVLHQGLCNCFCFFWESYSHNKFTCLDLSYHSAITSSETALSTKTKPLAILWKNVLFHVLDSIQQHLKLSFFMFYFLPYPSASSLRQ